MCLLMDGLINNNDEFYFHHFVAIYSSNYNDTWCDYKCWYTTTKYCKWFLKSMTDRNIVFIFIIRSKQYLTEISEQQQQQQQKSTCVLNSTNIFIVFTWFTLMMMMRFFIDLFANVHYNHFVFCCCFIKVMKYIGLNR